MGSCVNMVETKYFVEGVETTKQKFALKRKEMNDKFGCECIATYRGKKNEVLAKNLAWKFLEKSGIRGK